MENLVRTVYGAAIQTSLLTGIPLQIKEHSTLDEKFGGALPALLANEKPVLNVLVIGDGGHHVKTAADGNIVPKILQHRARDAALFRHRPFAMELVSASSGVKPGYCLAQKWTAPGGGDTYWAYWGKILTPENLVVQMDVVTVLNGVTTTAPFVPSNGDLNPVPPTVPPAGANTTDGTYVTTTAKIHLNFTPDEVAAYLNVSKILYGDDDFAIISEMGLCTGIVNVPNNPIDGNSKLNAKAVQVAAHMGCFYAMKQLQNGLDILVDVGVTEPMYNITPVTP